MIPLLIVGLVLLLLLLLPLGLRARYDEDGLWAALKLGPVLIQLFPSAKETGGKRKKKPKKDRPKQAEDHPKKGGPLALVKACLPLVRPTLEKVRRRLTVRHLTLHVVWAATDPADAALGYGAANAALGVLWPIFFQTFKVRDYALGVDVDFDATEPTLYAKGDVTMTVFQLLTLALPLLFQFLKIYRSVNAAPKGETVKKEA